VIGSLVVLDAQTEAAELRATDAVARQMLEQRRRVELAQEMQLLRRRYVELQRAAALAAANDERAERAHHTDRQLLEQLGARRVGVEQRATQIALRLAALHTPPPPPPPPPALLLQLQLPTPTIATTAGDDGEASARAQQLLASLAASLPLPVPPPPPPSSPPPPPQFNPASLELPMGARVFVAKSPKAVDVVRSVAVRMPARARRRACDVARAARRVVERAHEQRRRRRRVCRAERTRLRLVQVRVHDV
jgi:hypothetical protein